MHTAPSRHAVALLGVTSLALLGVAVSPASAVSTDQGAVLVAATPTGTTAATRTPHVMNGSVDAITQVGNTIVAAGTFTSVSPAATYSNTSDDVARQGLFAFDATTGAIAAFNPSLGGPARSLTTDGTSVYVGGSFSSVGGVTAIKRVVKLTAAGAVVPGFKAVPNSTVNEVVYRSGRLYVGGGFTSIKSGPSVVARSALAALNPSTGAVLSEVNVPFSGVYDPTNNFEGKLGGTTNVKRFDVTANGSKLVAIGNFATVGGQPHAQVAILDTPASASATVSTWATDRFNRSRNACSKHFDSFTRDLDISPDGSYFVVSTTGAFAGGAASGTLCDSTSRWELTASTGSQPSWVGYTGGDTTYGVAITGGAVYVGGHMRWQNNPTRGDYAGPGAVAREGIAALDPLNGLPLSWNPGRSRGVGAQALFATSQGLWVGSDTTRIGGRVRGRIALLPLTGGTTIPTVAPATLPNSLFLAGGTQSGLTRREVTDSGASNGQPPSTVNTSMDWSTVRGAFLVNGTLYYGLADGALYARTFDKSTGAVGPQTTVALYDDPETHARIPFAIANLTGIFYDTVQHRLYYTVLNDSRLYYRYFTPESRVVGAQTFTSPITLSGVAGMTLAGGKILYGSSVDGALRAVPFSAGTLTGSATVVSSDGSWRHRAIFVPNS